MSYTKISLCSKALLKIGASTITSFEEGTAEAEVAANLYPCIRDALLSSYPWSFAVTQVRLPRLAAAPLADYNYAYQLPNDFVRVISAGMGGKGRGITYRIAENSLHTDMPNVILTYIFRPDENSFPAYFSEALIAKLSFEFCIPLTESTSRAEFLSKLADDIVSRARAVDAQQATPRCFEDFTLVEVRQ